MTQTRGVYFNTGLFDNPTRYLSSNCTHQLNTGSAIRVYNLLVSTVTD